MGNYFIFMNLKWKVHMSSLLCHGNFCCCGIRREDLELWKQYSIHSFIPVTTFSGMLSCHMLQSVFCLAEGWKWVRIYWKTIYIAESSSCLIEEFGDCSNQPWMGIVKKVEVSNSMNSGMGHPHFDCVFGDILNEYAEPCNFLNNNYCNVF